MHEYQWLEELHHTHYATLLRLARNRLRAATGSISEAEDVVQDVFLLAAEKDIDEMDNPLGWMIRVMDNLCKKRVDHIVREKEKEERFIQDKRNKSSDRSVYAVERAESEVDELLWLLMLEQTLSRDDWELMRQYCIEKKPIDEIAARMGVSVGVLKVRIHRIRKKLGKNFPDV